MQSNFFKNEIATPVLNQLSSQVTTIPKTTDSKQNVGLYFKIQLVTVLKRLAFCHGEEKLLSSMQQAS